MYIKWPKRTTQSIPRDHVNSLRIPNINTDFLDSASFATTGSAFNNLQWFSADCYLVINLTQQMRKLPPTTTFVTFRPKKTEGVVPTAS